jgi:hypothetical protein
LDAGGEPTGESGGNAFAAIRLTIGGISSSEVPDADRGTRAGVVRGFDGQDFNLSEVAGVPIRAAKDVKKIIR